MEQTRQFYLADRISKTLSAEFKLTRFQVSWSHYLILMCIENQKERGVYEIESTATNGAFGNSNDMNRAFTIWKRGLCDLYLPHFAYFAINLCVLCGKKINRKDAKGIAKFAKARVWIK